ncbi:MerR family transcriptional regulator [Pseudofrankia inefficax]|uniref:Transcriptional regulator, MerR family n=1 Tax=Pseudofrankia inefficax (strain DSM 45817 / CECT 9037 / DDB 130130 / EuI1c) TaxID=298654 RepID=E3J8X4_PSEI1|nr:MerR family transcriptional regulator [Pseudofrankia inefficax]ADP79707.1 transcriptional regulator, MerR family [Pseudofrankia inefficax]
MTDSGTIAAVRGDQAGGPALAGSPGADATGAADGATNPAAVGAAAEPALLAIGPASREVGVSVRSLRYYEEMGLLTPSGRTSGGNRLYGPDDLARVRRIRELQQLLGFNLDEVRAILGHEDRLARVRQDWAVASTEDRVSLLDEAREVYLNLRDQVEGKIKGLVSFRDELDARVARNDRLRETLPG